MTRVYHTTLAYVVQIEYEVLSSLDGWASLHELLIDGTTVE